MAFLDASEAERDGAIREKEERRRNELRRARRLVLILATFSLAVLALGVFAFSQQRKAEKAQQRAEQALSDVRVQKERAETESRRADTARNSAVEQAQRADLERENAERQSRIAEEQRGIAESERQNAEAEERAARAQEAKAKAARREAEAQQKKAIEERERADHARSQAETSEEETRRLSHLASVQALALQIPQQSDQPELSAILALTVYRLHRDSRGNPEDPDLFAALRTALDRLRPATVLHGGRAGIRALAVAPDGTVVAGSDDGSLLRFDPSRPDSPPLSFGTLPSPVRALAIRPAGDLLAAGGASGEIRIWDLGSPGSAPRVLADGGAAVSSLAFQPAGSLLAAAGFDGTVRLWDLDGAAPAATLPGGEGQRVTAVAFSPDGKTLAAGLAPSGALLWDLAHPSAAPRAACTALDVRSLAFRPDGETLACGGGRGQIDLVSVGPSAVPAIPLLGHESSVNALSFDRSGESVASASSDGSVRLWDLGNPGAQPIVLPGHESWVWAVVFSPHGNRLISAGEDRTVRVWPARTKVLAGELCQVVHRGLTREEWSRFMPADLRTGREPPARRPAEAPGEEGVMRMWIFSRPVPASQSRGPLLAAAATALLLLGGSGAGRAQTLCDDALLQAERSYDLGLFEDVPGQLAPCLEARISRSVAVRVHSLLARAYLYREELAPARREVSTLLRIDPTFEAGSPARFTALVARVRREEQTTQVISVSKTSESLREAPATVTVVTGEEIQRRGYLDLEQLLHDLPGFDISRLNGTLYSSIYQRGYRSPENDRDLLLVDGVEQNELSTNVMYLSRQYPLTNVDRVEVIYGPASTMYGANAYTGVISIVTKEPEAVVADDKLFGLVAAATAGGYSSRSLDLTLAGKDRSGSLAWSLAGRFHRSDERDLSHLDDWDYNYDHFDYRSLMRLSGFEAENFFAAGLCATPSPYYQCGGSIPFVDRTVELTAEGEAFVRELDRRLVRDNRFGFDDHNENWSLYGKVRIANLTLGLELGAAGGDRFGLSGGHHHRPHRVDPEPDRGLRQVLAADGPRCDLQLLHPLPSDRDRKGRIAIRLPAQLL